MNCPVCRHRLVLVEGENPQNCPDFWFCNGCDGVFTLDDVNPNAWQPSETVAIFEDDDPRD